MFFQRQCYFSSDSVIFSNDSVIFSATVLVFPATVLCFSSDSVNVNFLFQIQCLFVHDPKGLVWLLLAGAKRKGRPDFGRKVGQTLNAHNFVNTQRNQVIQK